MKHKTENSLVDKSKSILGINDSQLEETVNSLNASENTNEQPEAKARRPNKLTDYLVGEKQNQTP